MARSIIHLVTAPLRLGRLSAIRLSLPPAGRRTGRTPPEAHLSPSRRRDVLPLSLSVPTSLCSGQKAGSLFGSLRSSWLAAPSRATQRLEAPDLADERPAELGRPLQSARICMTRRGSGVRLPHRPPRLTCGNLRRSTAFCGRRVTELLRAEDRSGSRPSNAQAC